MNTITINEIRNSKNFNDLKGANTYLIRNSDEKLSDSFWYKGELCFVKEASDNHVKIFRPMDGKEYILSENEIKKFILVGVII